MSVSQTMETEEDFPTCLRIRFFHPQQNSKGIYVDLPLGKRKKHPAEDPFRLGRDGALCTYSLADVRVSRKQLALYAYRTAQSPDMRFTIQNLSQKGRLTVNGSALAHLERADLPDKALIRFGEYEMEIVRESGEAKGVFEVDFEVLPVSPSRETCTCVPTVTAVMDTGHTPVESDETLEYRSC